MPTLLDLQQERNNLITNARAINDQAVAEKREMTAEQSANFDKYMDDADALTAKINDALKSEGRSKRLKDAESELEKRNGRKTDPADPDQNAGESRHGAVVKFEKRGRVRGHCDIPSVTEITCNDRRYAPMATPEARQLFREFLRDGSHEDELRNLQADIDTQAGYLAMPQQLAATLIAAIDDQTVIRQLATVQTLTQAVSLGAITRDTDIADSDWTTEIAMGNEDTALAFGKRELRPHPLAKRVKVSKKLLRLASIAESYVISRLAYKMGITQEKAFLTGDGVQKPLGLFTANSDGVSTARDVATGSATNFTGDGLIDALYSLKSAYQEKATWLFHRDATKLIRKLKDTDGQYLWAAGQIGQASLSQGLVNTILNRPVIMSEYVPNTFTSGLYVGMVGDFSYYWIVDALNMELQVVDQLYAATNQNGYFLRSELDGAPVLAEAFARLKTN